MLLRSGHKVGIPAGLLPEPAKSAFEEAVGIVLTKWATLALAVENEWGGSSSKQKAEELREDIIDWFFHGKEHYAEDLEELLQEALTHDYNVQCEDGSPKEVSDVLVRMYLELKEGQTATLNHVRALAKPSAKQSVRQVVDLDGAVLATIPGDEASDSSSDEDGDDAMEDDAKMQEDEPAAAPQPMVDEDGFTLVQAAGKGKRGGRR